jgi:hypothetical protein
VQNARNANNILSSWRCLPSRRQLSSSIETQFSSAGLFCGEKFFEVCPHLAVGQDLAVSDLREAFLHFPNEPLVEINEALDGFARQDFGVTSALSGKAG